MNTPPVLMLAGVSTFLLVLTWLGGIALAAAKWRSYPRGAAIVLCSALALLAVHLLNVLLGYGLQTLSLEPEQQLLILQLLSLLLAVVNVATYAALAYAIFSGRGAAAG